VRGQKNSSFIFSSVGIARLGKNKCAVCALAFFSTNFNALHDFPHYAQQLYMPIVDLS
jgi:hypothetical protein